MTLHRAERAGTLAAALADVLSEPLPDAFVPVPEIPKTSVGKFDKKAVRSLYASGKLGK